MVVLAALPGCFARPEDCTSLVQMSHDGQHRPHRSHRLALTTPTAPADT